MTLSTRPLLPLLIAATFALHGCGGKEGGEDSAGGGAGTAAGGEGSGDEGSGDDGGDDLPSEGTNAGECTDGADNDADGLFDCNDPDCAGSPDCSEANTPGGCSDGADNDQDGLFDCDDPDCIGDEACGDGIEGNDAGECEDGIDNDGDGLTDCEDDDCAGFEGCDDYEGDEPGECTDGEDNDNDGLTDCDDEGCAGSPDCEGTELACKSMRFDGNDTVTIPHDTALDITGDTTIEVWVRPTDYNNRVVFGKNVDWSVGYHLRFAKVSDVTPAVRWGSTYSPAMDFPTSSTDWMHIAITTDFAASETNLWVDGVLQSTGPAATSSCVSDLIIGVDPFRGEGFFDGDIAGIRFSNDVLYSASFTPPQPEILSSTVAIWRYSDGSLTTLEDLTGSGHDGVMNGVEWVDDCPWE